MQNTNDQPARAFLIGIMKVKLQDGQVTVSRRGRGNAITIHTEPAPASFDAKYASDLALRLSCN